MTATFHRALRSHLNGLGLPATVTGTSYELTADIIDPAQANFIARREFLNFLKDNGEAALRVAQQLGETYHSAIAEMRTIGLSHSASEKLARFLLEWAASCPEEKGQVRIKMTLTHEEIAQMIGSSRETVTRGCWRSFAGNSCCKLSAPH